MMRDDVGMRCEVVREALSARLDGESAHVPTQRVDAHLDSCRACRAWLIEAAAQTRRLASMATRPAPDLAERIMTARGDGPAARYRRLPRGLGSLTWRCALVAVGVFQVAVAVAQISGVDFGMVSASGHGATTGMHLLHESTAWLLASGLAMIAAGVWTVVAVGVAAVLGAFSIALLGYVAVDAYSGQVTAARIASHAPVLAGLMFALLVTRERAGAQKRRATDAGPTNPARPPDVRRGHLRPVNRSLSTTVGRRRPGRCDLRWMLMTARRDDETVTALALAAAGGDSRALEAFVKATQADVWRFVGYLSGGGEADDLTQETFLRALGGIDRFSGRSTARTWLLAIARHVVADHVRRAQSRPRIAHGTDPEDQLARNRSAGGFEDLVEVTTMIASLGADQREALVLTQLLGLSYSDASAVCGCPVGTIRSRVARARDALIAHVERGDLTG
jgi:RNA polymerase sigma-70 factor (ECF subfamily)